MGIMRIDDVSPNTDFSDFKEQISILRKKGFKLIVGVNLFCKESVDGALYPDLPLSQQPMSYLLNVDKMLRMQDVLDCGVKPEEIVSHGLVHTNHARMSRDAQMVSILTSCSFLGTKRFIPPFNAVDETTKEICSGHGIEIIGNTHDHSWQSLESQDYMPDRSHWYYHPWRIDAKKLAGQFK